MQVELRIQVCLFLHDIEPRYAASIASMQPQYLGERGGAPTSISRGRIRVEISAKISPWRVAAKSDSGGRAVIEVALLPKNGHRVRISSPSQLHRSRCSCSLVVAWSTVGDQ